ncbi:cyclase family protein [Leucobacter weissii]|uniref:Cyclase family protein n=1 Tax=Leucobacter weissii TaxID=1983706 RepID=A0A939MIZ6_9MICO|nr:cyclase family protein [Leucobacter weissii]MBO1901814.1 cyclase family protein [Leucobacter weissii]
MRTVDLSRPIRGGMPVYPGDPEVSISRALTVAADGVEVARLELGSHTGTHLDAPSHSIDGGAAVDEIPLDLCWGPALVLRVRPVGADARIGPEQLEAPLPDELPARVLVATGWDRYFGDPLAPAHPSLTVELAERLWEAGARLLGVDTLSPDPTGEGALGAPGAWQDSAPLPVHDLWLGRGGVIVENLMGLVDLPETIELVALPLRLDGVDGSPVRAVARVRR